MVGSVFLFDCCCGWGIVCFWFNFTVGLLLFVIVVLLVMFRFWFGRHITFGLFIVQGVRVAGGFWVLSRCWFWSGIVLFMLVYYCLVSVIKVGVFVW